MKDTNVFLTIGKGRALANSIRVDIMSFMTASA